ncbi:MAG: photosystem II biogenesis protein Psp29 [Leptolyngbyaceae cyanobacterium bins.59]|nr:photosystem II biogenesis protein Psp29 [Leptolyngbyaceae cyanobacterium bins.59]
MNNVRTVSDTKRTFYSLHTRPVHSIYRRVVDELMVEMHLLSVNLDFRYDPIYALGIVSAFNRFMQSYQPEPDKASIFNALCRSVEADPEQYQRDAAQVEALARGVSANELIEILGHPDRITDFEQLRNDLHRMIGKGDFKYSRLFAIGLLTLLELSDPELVKDEKQRIEVLKQICEVLHLPQDKLEKDLDLYRSNLEKMIQAQIVIEDALKADRKQREQREQAKNAAPTSDDASKDGAASGS